MSLTAGREEYQEANSTSPSTNPIEYQDKTYQDFYYQSQRKYFKLKPYSMSIPWESGELCEGQFVYYSPTLYPIFTGRSELQQISYMLDGVVTTTTQEYKGTDHYFPTASTMTNSDSKVHRTETKYTKDSNIGAAAKAEMLARYMIGIPIEVTKKVDDVIVGGRENHYALFNGHPRLEKQKEKYQGAATRTMVTLDYDTNGNISSVGRRGQPLETYTWENNLVKTKNIIDWHWTYDYYPGTKMLQKITDLNNIESTFSYDDLSRLIKSTERNGGIEMTYNYRYTLAGGGTKNHIKTYNGATKQWTYQYFDGLGRNLQSVKKQYSPNHRDVVDAILYDSYGRIDAQYLPYEGGGQGNYADPRGPKTRFTYEANPLSREHVRTFADNNSIFTAYGCNSAGEVSGGYSACSLFKQVVTDENGHRTETFTNKIGQLILTRRYIDGAQRVDTYNEYDDRGNLTGVMPPETSNPNDPAAYKYEYNVHNLLTTKKIPDAGEQTFSYDSEDRLVTSTDANGTTLTYNYDAYSRQKSTYGPGGLLIDNTYDTGSGAVKGKLTEEHVATLGEDNVGSLLTTYHYDDIGRVGITLQQNHMGGADATTNTYYGATDIVLSQNKSHNGFIKIKERYKYDHSFRVKETWHKLNDDPWVLLSDQGYDHKDQLIGKAIGGEHEQFLQSIGYSYNVRGWLTGINRLPLDNDVHIPFDGACITPEDSIRERHCAYEVSLEELLDYRLLEDINVNCFDPCEVAPSIGPVSSLSGNQQNVEFQTASMEVLENKMPGKTAASLTYPTRMYRLELYEGSRLLLADELPQLDGDFVIEECVEISSPYDQIKVMDKNGIQSQKSVDSLLLLRITETPDFVEPDSICPYDPDYCENFFDLCQGGSTEMQASMWAGLQASLAAIDPANIKLPTELYLVQFCDSSMQYVLEQELSMLAGSYRILQTIPLTSLSQILSIISANNTGSSVTLEQLLAIRAEGDFFLVDGFGCGVQTVELGYDCEYFIELENWDYQNIENAYQATVSYDLVVSRDCGQGGSEEILREHKNVSRNTEKYMAYVMDGNSLLQHGAGHLGSIRLSTRNPQSTITVDLNPHTVLSTYPLLQIDTSHLYYHYGLNGQNPSLFKRAIKQVIDYAIDDWANANGISPAAVDYRLQVTVPYHTQNFPPGAVRIQLEVKHNPAGPYVGIDPQSASYIYYPDGQNSVEMQSPELKREGTNWTEAYNTPCGYIQAYVFDTLAAENDDWFTIALALPSPEAFPDPYYEPNRVCPASTIVSIATSCTDPICIWTGTEMVCCGNDTIDTPDDPVFTCSFTEEVIASSVHEGGAFAQFYQDSTIADLRLHHGSYGYSIVDDEKPWSLLGFSTSEYSRAEVAWDVGRLFRNDSEIQIQDWSASIDFQNWHTDVTIQAGLAINDQLIPLSGGAMYTTVTQAGTLVLSPQDSLSVAQIENISVALFIDITSVPLTDDSLSIDAVWADLTYKGTCGGQCVIPTPTCSEEQLAMQMAALDSIRTLMSELQAQGVNAIPYPTHLNRVVLCDGSMIYLFDHELDVLTGGFTIVQQVAIGGPGGTYTVGSGDGPSVEEDLAMEDLFGMELHYYEPNYPLYAFPQYNGNIAWVKWQVKGRDQHYYGYRYDELDRLKRATFGEGWEGGGMKVTNKYTVDSHQGNMIGNIGTIQYDKRGNIKALRRNGGSGDCNTSSGYGWDIVDQLDYSYSPGTNQLESLTDANNQDGGILYNQSAFEYDANGNLTKDPGKNISKIVYNYLNLPEKIAFADGNESPLGEIKWTYDAKGNKLVKRVGNSVVKEYLPSGVEYDGEKVEAVYHAEGRAIPIYDSLGLKIDSFRYEYVLRDHLGNGRIYFSDLNEDSKIQIGGTQSEILQENHYYPFGLNQEGPFYPQQPITNPYQYNGKELNEEFNLNWNDYGARFYDPAVGRFTTIDPLANDFSSWSPYNYTLNNPVLFIDPDGRAPCPPNGGCGKVLAVFYHGGPSGGGKTTTAGNAGGAGAIYNSTESSASNSGRGFVGRVIAPGVTSASGVENGLKFIKDNYEQGDQVIIYGYSYGTDGAVDLSEQLLETGVPVDLLITVDGSDGPLQNSTVNSDIPENVSTNLNIYQTDDSGTSSSSKSSGATSSNSSSGSSSSDSGTSNLPGSNGGPNKAKNPSKTNVINRNVSAPGTTHGNIQQKQRGTIESTIKNQIQNY